MDNQGYMNLDNDGVSSLSQFLLQDNLIDHVLLSNAMRYCRAHQVSLTYYLVQANLLSSEQILACCCAHFDLPVFHLRQFDSAIFKTISFPLEWMRRFRIIPVNNDDRRIQLGVTDPTCYSIFAKVRFHAGLPISLVLINEAELESILSAVFPNQFTHSLETLLQEAAPHLPTTLTSLRDADHAEEEPVIQLVKQLLVDADLCRASDIHCDPALMYYRIRFRIDGHLQERVNIPNVLALRMLARIKLLANLDVTEKRLPQDGRMSLHEGAHLEIRVSTCPTLSGEKLVMRVFKQQEEVSSLAALGFLEEQLQHVMQAIAKPYGLILVTGPTGSGKSSTLYAMIHALQNAALNIITIEEPVERVMSHVNQINVNTQLGFSFAEALRAILRQDPDVIMIGEIRDTETARIALQAAATGHLVLGTLHANHTLAVFHRLALLDIPLHDSMQSLLMVVAQRLVRQFCQACYPRQTCETMVMSSAGLCTTCVDGYRGRTGVFEVLLPDDYLYSLMLSNTPLTDIAAALKQRGWLSLQCAATQKIALGMTSQAEMQRVIGYV